MAIKYITTGAFVFDLVLGGGYPWGKMVNLIGDFSTGKTLFSCEAIAQARIRYGKKLKWFYDDAEAGFSIPDKMIYGFEICSDEQKNSETIEDFELNLTKYLDKLKDDEFLIYVLDSFDALSSRAEIERAEERHKKIAAGKAIKKDSYNLEKQQMLNEFFRLRRLQIKNKNCLLIIVSQVRDNIGVMFGRKYKRNGGKALDMYAAQKLWLAESEKYETKFGDTYGISVKVKNDKNKVGKPYRTCYVDIMYDEIGVDDIRSNILFLYDLKTETGKTMKSEEKKKVKDSKTGKEKTEIVGLLKWDDKLFNFEDLCIYIDQNNLHDELHKKVQEKWDIKEAECSLVSKGRTSKKDLLKQYLKENKSWKLGILC